MIFNFDFSKFTKTFLARSLVTVVRVERVNQIKSQLLFEGLGNPKKLEKISSISLRDLQEFYENEWKASKHLKALLGSNKNSVKKLIWK